MNGSFPLEDITILVCLQEALRSFETRSKLKTSFWKIASAKQKQQKTTTTKFFSRDETKARNRTVSCLIVLFPSNKKEICHPKLVPFSHTPSTLDFPFSEFAKILYRTTCSEASKGDHYLPLHRNNNNNKEEMKGTSSYYLYTTNASHLVFSSFQ